MTQGVLAQVARMQLLMGALFRLQMTMSNSRNGPRALGQQESFRQMRGWQVCKWQFANMQSRLGQAAKGNL